MQAQPIWRNRLGPWVEWAMIALGFVWLVLFVIELGWGLTPWMSTLGQVIWIIFIVEFAVRLARARARRVFLRRNWLTALALLLPALRVLRVARAARALFLLRSLGTANRGVGSLERLLEGELEEIELHVGLLPLVTPTAAVDEFEQFCQQLGTDLQAQLEAATGARWRVHVEEAKPLETSASRCPADFLDEATTQMSEQAFDIALVVTDAPLSSRRHRLVAGLPSSVAHIAVLSTRNLRLTPRDEPSRRLTTPAVRWNAATLALHLLGHILGLAHTPASPVMQPFRFDPERRGPAAFSDSDRDQITQVIRGLPEHEVEAANRLAAFAFHLMMTVRHPAQVFLPVWRSGAFLLSLRLPSLITAAVVPAFVLVFTAEIWDVGFGMRNAKVAQFSLLSMTGATLYLAITKNLFFPNREKRILTEHIAVVNAAIFFTVLAAVIGVFVMLALLMLLIELYFFPPDLMSTWPTLEVTVINTEAKVRLAAFISSIGVTTGALAGGMESRTLIRHLALFGRDP